MVPELEVVGTFPPRLEMAVARLVIDSAWRRAASAASACIWAIAVFIESIRASCKSKWSIIRVKICSRLVVREGLCIDPSTPAIAAGISRGGFMVDDEEAEKEFGSVSMSSMLLQASQPDIY